MKKKKKKKKKERNLHHACVVSLECFRGCLLFSEALPLNERKRFGHAELHFKFHFFCTASAVIKCSNWVNCWHTM